MLCYCEMGTKKVKMEQPQTSTYMCRTNDSMGQLKGSQLYYMILRTSMGQMNYFGLHMIYIFVKKHRKTEIIAIINYLQCLLLYKNFTMHIQNIVKNELMNDYIWIERFSKNEI